jgi:NADH:ubiquinone oxidoreductase subunit 5 (subunit L)/multisubunit Na+/H+ antiporter MnhA subunit
MTDPTLLFPLITIFAGALIAALFGLPWFNRRLTITQLSWLLALVPLIAFVLLAGRIPVLNQGTVFTWRIDWLPSLGIELGFYFDSLSALFALLVTFIGVLIIIYTGQYFKGDQGAWRFLTYLLLFMGAMLGLVMAGDVLTLFIFWEGTSITSYLLIAYKYKDEAARRGGFKGLFITGGGGIALLAGLLFVAYVAGSAEFATILKSGDVLRNSEFYFVMLALVAFGAFTKSAQFPAHIWLPSAMSAPTPASAYLHSATMVKAGIYLLARLNPALGFTESWFWLLTLVGMTTMLVGAYLGLKQNDLKALLAYSTISQLGILMMLIGQEDGAGYKALVIGVLAHALYKSALFLLVGIVDHETGTRDLRRLGGLRKSMPYTFALAFIAGLSMAGLPPLFGFLAKETLLATAIHPTLPPSIAWILPWASVVAGALMLAQAGLLVWGTFLGQPRDPTVHGHEAPWAMLLAPAVPALLSVILSILPGPKDEATFFAGAASAAFGDTVKVSFELFHGLNVPFFLSVVAISLGFTIFVFRARVRAFQMRLWPNLSFNAVYAWVLKTIDQLAYWATRLQQGKLRTYLVVMIASTILLVFGFSPRTLLPSLSSLSGPALDFTGEIIILRVFVLFVIVGASVATVLLYRDFYAILALGAAGLSVAVLMVLEPAPDVALVQIVVDILAVVILVLALTRLPRPQRRQAQEVTEETFAKNRGNLLRDAVVAGASGLVVMLITLTALLSRSRQSVVTPYYETNAKTLTGATDIVGSIVVDFRALDTLIEIAVFSLAGLGIYTLLRYAARKHGDRGSRGEDLSTSASGRPTTFGIGDRRMSSFIRTSTFVLLPLAMVLAATHMMYGHDQPGDGFTAGVIVSLSVGLWYVVFGYQEARQRLNWLKPSMLIGTGILLAIVTGTVAGLINGHFLSNVDFGELIGLPLPRGFHISTSFLFEVSICLSVLGSVAHMLSALGQPEYKDAESTLRLQEISEQVGE